MRNRADFSAMTIVGMKRHQRQSALTLIELLVGIPNIALLAAILLPALANTASLIKSNGNSLILTEPLPPLFQALQPPPASNPSKFDFASNQT